MKKKAAKGAKSRKPRGSPKAAARDASRSAPVHVAPRPSSSDNVFMHESAYVDEGARIGGGTKIWHFCHVMPGAVIGDHCNLGQNVVVMNGVRVGNNVKIQNNVSLYEGVELEDDVF